MNPKPPRLAEWLLTRAVPGAFADSLAGDLAEEFARRQSSAWYWRQVAIALAARTLWPLALRATWLMGFLGGAASGFLVSLSARRYRSTMLLTGAAALLGWSGVSVSLW